MRKDFVEVVNEVCGDEKISTAQLAERLKITKKELEDYLSRKKKPGLELIAKFSSEFDLSLDYFLKDNMRESMSIDLVAARNSRGKFAIFDTMQGSFLTQFLYDLIDISPCGKHIVRKKQEGSENVYRETIIDNKGEESRISNFKLSVIGNTFQYGVYFPATSTLDNKEYLIDENGKALSKGYDYISPCLNIPHFSEPKGYEFFWGGTFKNGGDAMDNVLLGKNGKVVNLKLEKNTYKEERKHSVILPRFSVMPELNTIEKATAAIKKYGKMIVSYLPKEILIKRENYPVLARELYKYASKELKNGESYETVLGTLKFALETMKNLLKIWLSDEDEEFVESLGLDLILSNLRHEFYLIKQDKISKAERI